MTKKTALHLTLTGILTGTPALTTLPHGKWVYQKTRVGHGNIPGDRDRRHQVRRWVQGTQVNTSNQQPYKARFALGVGAWHALTPEEKETWRKPGEKLHLNRFQCFMRNWCRTHPPGTATTWDMGTTAWDAGTTIWPLPEGTQWDDGSTTWDAGATLWD